MTGRSRALRGLALAAVMLLTPGCVGMLAMPDADAGSDRTDASRPDGATTSEDASGPAVDASTVEASTVDASTPGGCAVVTCGANARCEPTTASCVCLPGFVSSGAACTAAPPGDPSTRTLEEVCAAWTAGHEQRATTSWVPGAGGACDPGSMTREALDDTLRRINHFRWMIGLDPVVDRPEDHARQQQCARMMDANGMLSHSPPTSWTCYTAEGAAGAGSSNLALGVGSSADTIDLYVSDNGVPSLGHRRWVFNPPLGSVGIGHLGSGGCLGVFNGGGSSTRAWTAWPPPGPVPLEAVAGTRLWSFHASGASAGSVRVVRVSDGMDLGATAMALPSGYGPDTVAWDAGGSAAAGTYRVTVNGTPLGEITYDVTLSACP